MKDNIHTDSAALNLPGVVVAANEASTFQQSYFSEPLTEFAAGLPDESGLEALLDFVAPPVQTPRRFEFRVADRGRYLAEDDDVRALDANFREITAHGKLENGRTLNKGLTFLIDRDRIPADAERYEQSIVQWLWNMLLRQEIIRGLGGLAAAATKVNVEWLTDSDPDADMLMAIKASNEANGLEKNRGLMGSTLRLVRKLVYQGKVGTALAARANLSDADLAEYLELEELRKLSVRGKSGSAYPPIYRNSAFFYNASQSPIIDDPSHIKRAWSPCDNGAKMKVYRQERTEKIVAISVEHYSQILLPLTAGITQVIDASSATTPTPPKKGK